MSFLDRFSWFKSREQTKNPAKREGRRPQPVDLTDSLVANRELTSGLFHGSYPGLKLASALAFTPIAAPVRFMGIPIPKTDDEKADEILSSYVARYARSFPQIHLQCHREGTIWVWPHYSAKKQLVLWEFIPDDTVTDVVRDLDTGEVTQLITDEEITASVGFDKTVIVRRRRTFTAAKITVEWGGTSGAIPQVLRDASMRNPLGSIPIAFANNRDGSEVRGHSDYERILSDLKDYHDIDLKQSTLLAKFEPKMIQEGEDFDEWMDNNGFNTIGDIHVAELDFIFNRAGKEKTEYISLKGSFEPYEAALTRKFLKIMEGSNIPEMLWGPKMAGNHASAEEQMDGVVKYVEDKRDQKADSYAQLFRATLALERYATMREGREVEITVEWNALDAVSESMKATIFQNFASGVSSLMSCAGLTKDQLFRLWRGMYPAATEDDFERFVVGLSAVAKHKSFASAPYEVILDLEGYDPEEYAQQQNARKGRLRALASLVTAPAEIWAKVEQTIKDLAAAGGNGRKK